MIMAILIEYDKDGNAIFRSLKGIGTSAEEREKAYRLDNLLKVEMKKLDRKLKKIGANLGPGSKNKVRPYWELGRLLRKIFEESGLVIPEEKSLYLVGARQHVPLYLLADDRRNDRNHLEYCFRLGWYPKKDALKRKWSEWVNLFDRPSINQEERFEKWDLEMIKKGGEYLKRKNTRLFAQLLTSMLKNIYTKDLSDEELTRCYDATWLFTEKLMEEYREEIKNKEFKATVKNAILKNRNLVGMLIEGSLLPNEFANELIKIIRIQELHIASVSS